MGEAEPEAAAKLIGGALPKLEETAGAAEAVVDAVWSHDVQLGAIKIESARRHLAALVRALEFADAVPSATFKKFLDEELLEMAGLTNAVVFVKRMKKLNTDQVYRQRKYNLLHEESEGYSKVTTLLSRLRGDKTLVDAAKTLRALIGGFDLDPNRVLDVILESLEYDCGGSLELANAHFNLVWQLNLGASLSDVIGFKFQHYHNRVTPRSLCCLAAMLLSASLIDIGALLPHIAPSLEALADNVKDHANAIDKDSRRLGFVSLGSLEDKQDASIQVTATNDISGADMKKNYVSSQLFGVTEALLWDRRWRLTEPLLTSMERVGALPGGDIGCRHALCSLVHFTIDPIYAILSPRSLGVATLWSLVPPAPPASAIQRAYTQLFVRRLETSEIASVSQLLAVLEPLSCHLNLYAAFDASLMTKLARVVKYLLEVKLLEHNGPFVARRLLKHVLLPALSLLPANPGCVLELWSATKCLPYKERHLLYTTWRGRAVERGAIGTKHFEVTRVECKAGYDARQALKRVANEKKNSKHVGRSLAKIAHSNPFVVFHVILSQIESYDNMIQPIVESFGFMTPLALDVLSYMLPLHLADLSRSKLQDDGITISHWFQYLAHFTGVFYRAYPQTELRPLLDFLLVRLEAGGSLELLVFNELLARMGGCEVLEDISDSQIGGLAGGETLRREMLAFDKSSKRAVSKLQDALCTPEIAVPMLVLIAQQRGYALFKGDMGHIKLLGQLFDRCQLVLVQLVEFLSRSNEQASSVGANEKHSYLELLPDFQTLCLVLRIEPQIALHAARPLVAAAAARQRALVKEEKSTIKLTTKLVVMNQPTANNMLDKWDSNGALMKAAMLASLPSEEWEAMTTEFYLIFWSLSLYDIKVPIKAYDTQIAILRAKYNTVQREVEESDKRKKEMTRCLNVVDVLTTELAAQKDHCKQILGDLEMHRDKLLGAVVEDQRRSISEAVLQRCVMPRVTVTPEDALFCATFFHKLHALETPNFSSLQYYDRVVKDVFPVVYCATDREAHCLGVFLRATFEPLKRWRFDRRLYDKEAASKPGFSVAIGSPARCSYDQYCTVFFKWYDKITKITLHCLDQYKDHGRGCILVLIKLIGIYPVRKRVNEQLMDKLEAIRKQEDMKDLQAMAQRYHTLLSKRKDTLFEDSSTKHNLPGNKVLSSILPSKRQTSSAKITSRESQTKVSGKGNISGADHNNTAAFTFSHKAETAATSPTTKGHVNSDKVISVVENSISELCPHDNESCLNEITRSQVRLISSVKCHGDDSDMPASATQRSNRSDVPLHVRRCSTDHPKQDSIQGKPTSPSAVKPILRRYDLPSKRPRNNEHERSKCSREEEKRRRGRRL